MSIDSFHQPTEPAIVSASGEPLAQVLDMRTWTGGADLAALYASLREAVTESVEWERRLRDPIRQVVLNHLGSAAKAPAAAGLYRVTPDEIERLHRGLLFNGGIEACDGTVAVHDSLILSVLQIGISLVAYQGNQGTWVQRFYQRDLRAHHGDPIEEAKAMLWQRSRSSSSDGDEGSAPSRLFSRALMEYAERAALLELSERRWRMGHGNPIPVTLWRPASRELVRATANVTRRLIKEQPRFVYVVSEPSDRFLLTLGDALEPGEFAVVESLETRHPYTDTGLEAFAGLRGYSEERRMVAEMLRDVRADVVVGVFRAAEHAPARVFYAHRDFACEAAAIAIADSLLQPLRGFPMLIDLADLVCRHTFDSGSFKGTLTDAYAAAGEPTRYLGERETRS
jgi:hypothetical protein